MQTRALQRDGATLQAICDQLAAGGALNGKGRPFRQFGGMRSREMVANWLPCVVLDYTRQADEFTFSSDPIGGDGIITNTVTDETWPTEHVLVPRTPASKFVDVEVLILKAIAGMPAKGGAAYASGKTWLFF